MKTFDQRARDFADRHGLNPPAVRTADGTWRRGYDPFSLGNPAQAMDCLLSRVAHRGRQMRLEKLWTRIRQAAGA